MKRAVVIGINYTGTNVSLSGCINDANHMRSFLSSNGYNDIVMLTDNTISPTKQNIVNYMNWLTQAENSVFYYSGHGGDITGYNENCIFPIDYQTAGVLSDQDLRTDLVNKMPSNSNLLCILDACKSATLMELKWTYCINNNNIENLNTNSYPLSSCYSVCFTSSKDDQDSENLNDGSNSSGVFTNYFIQCYSPSSTYYDLLKAITDKINQNYNFNQTPCMSFGSEIAYNNVIIL